MLFKDLTPTTAPAAKNTDTKPSTGKPGGGGDGSPLGSSGSLLWKAYESTVSRLNPKTKSIYFIFIIRGAKLKIIIYIPHLLILKNH
ncbi:hypothetical protein GCM10008088_21660 [Mesonia mobilis]|uniref:Uncharacterized protein n=1 Tax=Mesonia mobilis TaxID=369791 RepID=A0ABQ3BWV0_9FLAO|nr:hypothetical protein GCM10008088_21660 [Mesonia mobilis]